VQYAPNLFPALKIMVDRLKKERLFSKSPKKIIPLIYLTGSNQVLLDKNVKESLVGRASYYYLNTLSVHEIKKARPEILIKDILFKGGWPEIYTNPHLSIVQYLNDYIRSYLEKEIVLSAGISKQKEFHTVLGMLAARTGEFLNYTAFANHSGVKSVTVKDWISLLERSQIVSLLPAFSNNLNKRLLKSPKLYFLDTGLAVRLQGWTEVDPFFISPQAGHVFETLVFAEIMKFISNHGKDWHVFVWHTKEGEEVDFIIETDKGHVLAIDAKMGIHSVKSTPLPPAFVKQFGTKVKELIIVSLAEQSRQLGPGCLQLPLTQLTAYLKQF
jgi:predicted AAA+ superfamily ATPase